MIMKESAPDFYIDFSILKAQKLVCLHDSRTLNLSNYLSHENLEIVPSEYNWGKHIEPDSWDDMGNLKRNLCTCAAAGHFIMTWTSNTGKLHKPGKRAILYAYKEVTGYNPKTDGIGEAVESIKVLKHWRKKGISKRKIVAFAQLEDKNWQQLIQTIYLFGGCYVGLNLPATAEAQFNNSEKWTVPPGDPVPEGVFGHAILVTGYKDDELRVITWGKEMIMTKEFWQTYAVEGYAIFSKDFITNKKTPAKIDVKVLLNDIEKIKKKKAGK